MESTIHRQGTNALHTKFKGRHMLTNTAYYEGAWQEVPSARLRLRASLSLCGQSASHEPEGKISEAGPHTFSPENLPC